MNISIHEALQQGNEAFQSGKLGEAEELYSAILRSIPDHPNANYNLGALRLVCGEHEKALPLFEKALAVNKDCEAYWVSCIETLLKLGKVFDARKLLRLASKSGFKSDRIFSLTKKLHPSRKLEFFYEYLESIGIFNFQQFGPLNGSGEKIPLLTNSFLAWFGTQCWASKNLLEFGSGNSTSYFAKEFKSVTSFETNEDWYEAVTKVVPENVYMQKVDSIIQGLENHYAERRLDFDVVLVDAAENRANLSRWLVDRDYKGVIFFDNSEWYRNSIAIFSSAGFVEIPFFGIKPGEDWVSCTSVLAPANLLPTVFKSGWYSMPEHTKTITDLPWDDECAAE